MRAGFHIGRGFDQCDDLVQVFKGHHQAFEDMRPGTRLFQVKLGAALDDRQPVIEVDSQGLFKGQQARFVIHQRQQIDAEGGLHRGALVKRSQDLLGLDILCQFDDNAQTLPVRFIAQVGDPLQLPIPYQFSDPLDQAGFIDLVGNSVTIMRLLPRSISSIWALAWIVTRPRPLP